MSELGPAWSTAVGEADWIGRRLLPFGDHTVASVVPAGFEAYARLLHPARKSGAGRRAVRWSEVAAWSGMPLRRDAQFHSVALPPVSPQAPAPWRIQGPEEGSMYLPDAEILAGLAWEWTRTPERCWFCVWDGYGWDRTTFARPGEPSVRLPDPVPAAIRNGPRVCLPHRDYLLYQGPAEAVTAAFSLSRSEQTPNLWWPADIAWCVATEIDLPWTYVGGPAGLIEQILGDHRIEALPAAPGDPVTHVEDWVARWAGDATASLLACGNTVISTPRGTVEARIARRKLWTATEADGSDGSGWVRLSHRAGPGLRDEICRYLTRKITSLVD